MADKQNGKSRFSGQTVLVTGASRGIGRAAAAAFAGEGAHLILLARTRGGLEEVDDQVRRAGSTATLIELDLRDSAKLDALGPNLFQRFGHIDGLIASAGILGTLGPLPHVSDKDWSDVMAVNLTANWRLIRTLDPLLRRAHAARAVFISSGAAKSCRAYWGPYAASKAGLEALVKVYANELASTPARANILDPGAIRTAMRAKAMPGEDPGSLPPPEVLAPIIVAMTLASFEANGQVVRAEDHEMYPASFRRTKPTGDPGRSTAS